MFHTNNIMRKVIRSPKDVGLQEGEMIGKSRLWQVLLPPLN